MSQPRQIMKLKKKKKKKESGKGEDTTVRNVTDDFETEEEEERGGVSNERSNIIRHSESENLLTKCGECLEVQNEAVAR